VSRYHLVYQHEMFPAFYSTSSSSSSSFFCYRCCVAWSFLLHNGTPYFVDHMSLILIFPISITTVGRVLEVCHFTTTIITTDSMLPFAKSCRLKVTEGLPLPCSCQRPCHLQYLFCTCLLTSSLFSLTFSESASTSMCVNSKQLDREDASVSVLSKTNEQPQRWLN